VEGSVLRSCLSNFRQTPAVHCWLRRAMNVFGSIVLGCSRASCLSLFFATNRDRPNRSA